MNKTHQIDPHSHTNNRTEFRLNNYNSIIYTNIRLADIGTTPDNVNALYNYNGGVMNLVKSITLYSGNQQLDKIDSFYQWNGFKNIIGTQDDSIGLNSPNTSTNISIGTSGQLLTRKPTDITAALDFNGKFNIPLPILVDDGYLFFNDLRVVIEWNSDPFIVYATANRPNTFTIKLPSLIYSEFITPDFQELKKEALKEPLLWSSIENDVVSLPEIVIGGPNPSPNPQFIDTRVRGFDGKNVNRLVVASVNNTVNQFVGLTHSVAQNLEKINFRVNGRLLMPYDGINNENQKLRSLSSWGDSIIFQAGQYTMEKEGSISQGLQYTAGQFSYASFDVGQKINDLHIQYTRTGKTGTPATDTSFLSPINIYIFSEVLKYAYLDPKGNIVVSYSPPEVKNIKTVKVKRRK